MLGARSSVEGILAERWVDLGQLDQPQLDKLRRTPSAGLGTSRHRPDDDELDQILAVCQRQQITAILAIGGNDTAETALRLSNRARAAGQSLQVMTAPKTIDNDLPGTDHCLGYGSAARFVALATRDAMVDTIAMADLYPVKIVEVMGRNAGWLAAAAALACRERETWSGLTVCLPERPLPEFQALLETVEHHLSKVGWAVLVTPETMRWSTGEHVSQSGPEWTDAFGHPYYPSVGDALARRLSAALGIRARYDKPGTIARSAMFAVSSVDLAEAEAVGREAVLRMAAGETGTMLSLQRQGDRPYQVRYTPTPLAEVALRERLLPNEMIDSSGHWPSDAFFEYALPLIGDAFEPYFMLDWG